MGHQLMITGLGLSKELLKARVKNNRENVRDAQQSELNSFVRLLIFHGRSSQTGFERVPRRRTSVENWNPSGLSWESSPWTRSWTWLTEACVRPCGLSVNLQKQNRKHGHLWVCMLRLHYLQMYMWTVCVCAPVQYVCQLSKRCPQEECVMGISFFSWLPAALLQICSRCVSLCVFRAIFVACGKLNFNTAKLQANCPVAPDISMWERRRKPTLT